MVVWVYSLPPPPRFRLFTVFHVPDCSKAQTSAHKTHNGVVLQQAGKKEGVAGVIFDSGFHFISGCRIPEEQSEITPALGRHRADDLGAGSRPDNCIVVTPVLLLFTNFLYYLLF